MTDGPRYGSLWRWKNGPIQMAIGPSDQHEDRWVFLILKTHSPKSVRAEHQWFFKPFAAMTGVRKPMQSWTPVDD